jgi:hypothetical protein|tara:strand:- start:79 stop:465 length:387 start_codon:yes stop_codon:yes gene_type:complete
MAETKTVLVNDGGAPARILNFTAAAAISAGELLSINSDGKAYLMANNGIPLAGVALVDAASGDLVSMVTGSGVLLRMICKADVVAGNNLMVDEAVAGSALLFVAGSDNDCVGIALEAGDGGLTKCLVF